MDKPIVEIDGRLIGDGRPAYIVAELSANHNRSFDQAVGLVKAAGECGVDAVKLQTYTPDTMTIDVDSELFRVGGDLPWAGRSLYDLYGEAYMPWEWQPKLKAVAEDLGLTLFSAAFDSTAVDFLEDMDVPAHKVASFELVDIPLIEKMAATGKPLIISTGMATLQEIEEAVEAARGGGAGGIILLKCTSAYPAPPEDMNLAAIPHLAAAFGVPVGLSDHTLGTTVPVAAVSIGACVVEKHFTLSRETKGPDSAFSLEPHELKAMVEAIRTAEKALGQESYEMKSDEIEIRKFRRSLFVVRDMKAGEVFTAENIRSIRPAQGLPPKHLAEVLGRKAAKDLKKGSPLSWDIVTS